MHKAKVGLDSIPSNLAIAVTDLSSQDVRGGSEFEVNVEFANYRNAFKHTYASLLDLTLRKK